jgi:predicted transcriptional regulator of viral defense system
VVRALHHCGQPVLTEYQLGLVVYRLIWAGRIGTAKQHRESIDPERRLYNQALRFLLGLGILAPVKGFADRAVFTMLGRSHPDSLEVLCTIDPFAYVSHLSAMEYHGLTDRVPTTIYLTSPPGAEWRALAKERMRRDLAGQLEGYQRVGLPMLRRLRFAAVGKRSVHITQRKHAGAFVVTEHGALRVASIGRTFLEMVAAPDLCGGIRHVIGVFGDQARAHLRLILADVDRHGTAIDKARVGYLLEEVCSVRDPVLERWQTTVVQRGGSRKLDAAAPYAPTYSERWGLSLNHQ